ncbi:MAG: hypothetical protein V7638_3978 [Acidobacteriota bacterium]
MSGRTVKSLMAIVWLLWFAGLLVVLIANLQSRTNLQPPLIVLPTPTPAPSSVFPPPDANVNPRMMWEVNPSELSDLLTSLGIVLGGLWAYFKFFKGRTFHRRLEPKITAKIVDQGNTKILIASMELTNIGLTVVYLNPLTSIDVYVINLRTPTDLSSVRLGHTPRSFRVFKNHSWIEPEETIRDEMMLRLPNGDNVSYQLKLVVRSENRSIVKRWKSWRKRRRLGGKWSSSCVAQKEPAEPKNLRRLSHDYGRH